MNKKIKILTVCNGGRVRSVALAEALRNKGCEAINASTYWFAPETMRMLCEWADIIAPVQVQDPEYEPAYDRTLWRTNIIWEYRDKIAQFPIGQDIYGKPQDPRLKSLIEGYINGWLTTVRARVYP